MAAGDALTVLVELVGAVALMACLAALATPKGGVLHLAAGRVFHGIVLAGGVVLAPLAFLSGDVFLALLAGLCAYLVHAGRREILRHRRAAPVGWPDHLGVGGLGAAGSVLIGSAVWAGSEVAFTAYTPLVTMFGLLLVYLAGSEWHRLRRPPQPHGWLAHHVGAMGVAGIALATGLGAAAYDDLVLPSWVLWLGPTLVGVPVVLRWLARVRAEGERATFF